MALLAGAACGPGFEPAEIEPSTPEQRAAYGPQVLEPAADEEEVQRLRSPDGRYVVEMDPDDGTTGRNGCHVVWLRGPDGERTHVIRLTEQDRGSGRSFSVWFTDDAHALIIEGRHAGLGCKPGDSEHFGYLYTIADGKLWNVGPTRNSREVYELADEPGWVPRED